MPLIEIVVLVCFVVFLSLGAVIGYCLCLRGKIRLSKIEEITENVTNIPIQGFDKNGKIFLWNRASELVYGHSRRDALGKKITDLILTDYEKELFLKNIEQVCLTKSALPPRQWMIVTRSGQRRMMYSTMFPYLENDKCNEIFCIDVDITNIKKHEEKLTVSRESYKAIFDGVNEAIFVHDSNNGKILDINSKACQIFEYAREELLTLSVEDISYGDKEEIKKKANTLISKAFYEGPQLFEWLGLSKTGKIIPLEINLKRAIIDKKECVLAILRDISSRKRIEEQLHKSEKRYTDLLENSNALIFTLNANGLMGSVNPTINEMFGYKEEEVIGRHFMDFLCKEEIEKGQKVFNDIIQGKQNKDEEFRCLKKDGKEIAIKLNAWPEFNPKKQVIGVHAIAVDITNQKLVMERMREMVIQIISMLSETVSVADRDTEKHCERLQEYALKTGEKLDLSGQQLECLKFAALLHDIGKVGIPITILMKKGKLTEEEWKRIREHPKKGADIVRQLHGFEAVAQVIEQHQERIDGKGYPLGLSEFEITKEATIISVVDAFDAMTSNRPYRKAMSISDALEELKKNAGTQFAEDVVKAFIEIIEGESKEKS